MPVTRINEFTARPGGEDALADFLASVIAAIREAEGCQSCELLRSRTDTAKLVIIEVWSSEDDHRKAAQRIPPEMMKKAMSLFGAPPKGEYFDVAIGAS